MSIKVPVIPNYDDDVLSGDEGNAASASPTTLSLPKKFTAFWYQYLNDLRARLKELIDLVQPLIDANKENMSIQGPYSASTNITADLYGVADTRPDTWGFTDFVDNRLTFSPPAGMRTRILRCYGNVYIMPKVVDPGVGPYPDPHGFTGMLWGLITTAPGGSTRIDFGADGCMAFYQAAMNATSPVGFDFDFAIGEGVAPGSQTMGLLETDNVLINRFATFLNTLQVPVHIESEFIMVYHFEPESV